MRIWLTTIIYMKIRAFKFKNKHLEQNFGNPSISKILRYLDTTITVQNITQKVATVISH